MNVVFTSLEALILKATLECLPTPDPAALDAFCAVMRDSAEGPALAARALAARVHAGSAHESLLALTALDHCMRRSDAAFHAEVGKFRFLNEMIKLVSPKYFAARTPPEVQLRVLQLLHAWTIEYPKETKFKAAFDMLRSQGVVKETPPPLPPEPGSSSVLPPRPRAACFEDDEKSKLLQKLLQSKNPVDLQFANKLIKNMVREEERRTEADSRRMLEVRQAVESARLLGSLLEQAGGAGEDERQLMRELDEACRRHHAALLRLAATTQGDNGALDEILQASDELTEVIGKYQIVMAPRAQPPKPTLHEPQAVNGTDSLLDFGGASAEEAPRGHMDPLSDIFSTENRVPGAVEPLKPFTLFSSEPTDAEEARGPVPGAGAGAGGLAVLDTLGAELLQRSLGAGRPGDPFPTKSVKKIPMNAIETTSPPPDAHLDLDFLVGRNRAAPPHTPAATPSTNAPAAPTAHDDLMVDISMDTGTNGCDKPNVSTYKQAHSELDENPHPISINKLEGILSNELTPAASNRSSVNRTNSTPIDLSDFDSILNLKKPEPPSPERTTPLDKTIELNKDVVSPSAMEVVKEFNHPVVPKAEVLGLADMEVPLASVQASSVPPLTILEEEEGLKVVLHVATNRPRPDVSVLVLSTTSRHSSPVSDYKFHAVVPKGCKVRLLPASGTCLPPHSAFLQPAAIIQLLLVARPPAPAPRAPLALRFVVTYACGGDTLTEMGEAALPLDQA